MPICKKRRNVSAREQRLCSVPVFSEARINKTHDSANQHQDLTHMPICDGELQSMRIAALRAMEQHVDKSRNAQAGLLCQVALQLFAEREERRSPAVAKVLRHVSEECCEVIERDLQAVDDASVGSNVCQRVREAAQGGINAHRDALKTRLNGLRRQEEFLRSLLTEVECLQLMSKETKAQFQAAQSGSSSSDQGYILNRGVPCQVMPDHSPDQFQKALEARSPFPDHQISNFHTVAHCALGSLPYHHCKYWKQGRHTTSL
jgi:hypothetical protein